MIQRIQSLYLLLASICVFLCYVFSFAQFDDGINFNKQFDINGFVINQINMVNLPYHVFIPLLAILSFISIFLYKNRKIQIILIRINYILHFVLTILLYFSLQSIVKDDSIPPNLSVKYGLGFFLPVAGIAFLILANRAIKRDEELIKSIDRLRG